MTFLSFVEQEFHRMASEYRYRLNTITVTGLGYCAESKCTQKHIDILLGLLREVAIPAISKFPGEVTPFERDWYAKCLKPQWEDIRNEYEQLIIKTIVV